MHSESSSLNICGALQLGSRGGFVKYLRCKRQIYVALHQSLTCTSDVQRIQLWYKVKVAPLSAPQMFNELAYCCHSMIVETTTFANDDMSECRSFVVLPFFLCTYVSY